MYGAVLWSDAARRRAVLWCEDQGPLAFAVDAEGLRAGDMAAFEVEIIGEHRLALDVIAMSSDSGAVLPAPVIEEAARQLTPQKVDALFAGIEEVIGTAPSAEDGSGGDDGYDDDDEFADEDAEEDAPPQAVWPSNVVPFRFTGLPRKRRD